MLAVFIERGCADGPKFATGELRLEQIRRIHRALAGTGTDDGVKLVDKENDLPLGFSDFFEECLQALFKFSAVLSTGEHAA